MIKERETELDSPAPRSGLTLVERLAEKLGAKASASTVFAEPVERDGVTVIPVSKVRYGFGGGGGHNDENHGEGGGGGGAVKATPLGYESGIDGSRNSGPARFLQ